MNGDKYYVLGVKLDLTNVWVGSSTGIAEMMSVFEAARASGEYVALALFADSAAIVRWDPQLHAVLNDYRTIMLKIRAQKN